MRSVRNFSLRLAAENFTLPAFMDRLLNPQPTAAAHFGNGASRRRNEAGLSSRLALAPQPLRPSWKAALPGIKSILISEDQLAQQIDALAQRILQDYQNEEPVIVGVLNGSIMFLADLIRRLPIPLCVDFIGVSSYRGQTRPGPLETTKTLNIEIKGRRVLIVDEILDCGRTLQFVAQTLQSLSPQDLRTCVLLEKTARRAVQIQADYVGFPIPNCFVVGYGLDYNGRYRNLPFLGVLEEEPCRRNAPPNPSKL